MCRGFLRRCWVYYCRVSFISFLVTASRCLPCISLPVMSPGDFLADIGEHRQGFRDPYHQQHLWRGVCGTATRPGAAGSLHLTGKHQTTPLTSWFELRGCFLGAVSLKMACFFENPPPTADPSLGWRRASPEERAHSASEHP